jgi:hypothetical protein
MSRIAAPRHGVHMTYEISDGRVYEFAPVPFIQCDRTFDLSGQEEVGSTLTIQVTGTLLAPKHLASDDNTPGMRPSPSDTSAMFYQTNQSGLNILDDQKRTLESILSVPGGKFRIYCRCPDGDADCEPATYFECYPQVSNISFQTSPDNWTQTIPYSFTLTIHRTDLFNGGNPIYLESIDENWSIEVIDEKIFPDITDFRFDKLDNSASRVMRLTHTLTATGKKVYGISQGDTRGFIPGAGDELLHDWRNKQAEGLMATRPEGFDPINSSLGGVSPNGIQSPYENARGWIESRLRWTAEGRLNPNGFGAINDFADGEFFLLDSDGIFNWPQAKEAFNHTRQKSGNETAGTYSVTESWIIIVGSYAARGASDEYTLAYSHNSATAVDTITIEGTVQGYQEGDIDRFDGSRATKITKAEEMFKHMLEQNVFLRRANDFLLSVIEPANQWDVSNAANAGRTGTAGEPDESAPEVCLNLIPKSKSIRKHIVDGTISYTYEFDTSQSNLFDDTLSESFTSAITYPHDVFATVTIPGRHKGPLFFYANTQTAPKYTLNYEIVLRPRCRRDEKPLSVRPRNGFVNGNPVHSWQAHSQLANRVTNSISDKRKCRDYVTMVARTHYDYIIDSLEAEIIRIESDNDSWNAAEGRYSGSLTFVFGSCASDFYLRSMTALFRDADRIRPRGHIHEF